MPKSMVLALSAKNSATESNPCPNMCVSKQSCPSMPSKMEIESINFEDAKEQSLVNLPRTLQILFKKASKCRKTPSWMVLRGKERRKNMKQIMQTLGNKKVINPYSADQLQSFLNALAEYGLEDEGEDVITEPPTTSVDSQEVCFDTGADYGNSEFLELEKQLKYDNLMMRSGGCKNRASDDARYEYKFSELVQLSSVEETVDAFSEEKLV